MRIRSNSYRVDVYIFMGVPVYRVVHWKWYVNRYRESFAWNVKALMDSLGMDDVEITEWLSSQGRQEKLNGLIDGPHENSYYKLYEVYRKDDRRLISSRYRFDDMSLTLK